MIQNVPEETESWWQILVNFLVENSIGDLASVAGVLIAVYGFTVTITNVKRSKSAAEQAKAAAESVKGRISEMGTISDLTFAIASFEEIKRHTRQKTWAILPERYSHLRRALLSIKKSFPDPSKNNLTVIQTAIQHTKSIEAEVEKIYQANQQDVDVVKMCMILAKDVDNLSELANELKEKLSGSAHV